MNLALLQGDAQALHNLMRGDTPKVKPLAARKDGCRELLRLGRRQNKDDVGRRLLQGLEQRVERPLREHVNLVDDVHAIVSGLRRIFHLFAQVANLIDTVVARRVDFQNVQTVFIQKSLTCRAYAAGIAVFRMLTVDRARQYLRCRGLARAARAAEQIRMRDAPAHNLAAERFDDRLLTDKILKPRRAIAAVQCLIPHDIPPRNDLFAET